MITEVVPKAQVYHIEAASLELQGYSFHPNFELSDSNLGASDIRGVAIYVMEDLNADKVTFDTILDDYIWEEIPLANPDRLLCGCIYRNPRKEKEAAEKSTNQVCNIISEAVNKHYNHLLICRYFNYPEIDWENESVGENSEHFVFLSEDTRKVFCINIYLNLPGTYLGKNLVY